MRPRSPQGTQHIYHMPLLKFWFIKKKNGDTDLFCYYAHYFCTLSATCVMRSNFDHKLNLLQVLNKQSRLWPSLLLRLALASWHRLLCGCVGVCVCVQFIKVCVGEQWWRWLHCVQKISRWSLLALTESLLAPVKLHCLEMRR